jgi:thiamine-phosphate pyrophosphorylase
MRGLYAICDLEFLAERGIDPEAFAIELVRARPAAIQLRAKGSCPRETLGILRRLVAIGRDASVPIFANDRPDLAVVAGAFGVHLGQGDLPLADARRIGPSLAFGISTHDLEQLDEALLLRPDYVALGPIFSTASKRLAEPVVGLETLKRARALSAKAGIPLVAIGGITLARLPEVAPHADAVACIGALVPSEGMRGVPEHLCRLCAALG